MNFSSKTLEFDRALELIAREAQTPAGRRALFELCPKSDRNSIERAHSQVSEAVKLAQERQIDWSFSGLSDPEPLISLLGISGAVAEPQMLLDAANFCLKALAARSALAIERDLAPNLWQIAEKIDPELKSTAEKIRRSILPGGEIDDAASPELKRIRSEISLQRKRITDLLENKIRSAGDAIRDSIVTVRNDRFVIPVKVDFRGKIGGVTHGFSSSGQTAFVEPLEAIEANNELQSLFGKQEREISIILESLTDSLRNRLPQVLATFDAVTMLDQIRAKRKFLERFNAVIPVISVDQTLEIIDARHPLLEESIIETRDKGHPGANAAIVPVTISLDEKHPAMIISGANAGGKTVVLKTAGLLSMLTLAGLPVPARSARIPLYRSILADIGDHQSLSANLSTFTSHMANIARMMDDCSPPALVLLDEVGTGTDPEEGSALGVAIVDEFRRRGAQIIASTHYCALKIYAANNPGVINASVEFDTKTLKPTYRLLTGLAGSSSGIEIASRFGIPASVIEKARSVLENASLEADKYLEKLREELRMAEDLRAALEAERDAVAARYNTLESEAARRETQRRMEFEQSIAAALDSIDKTTKALVEAIEDKVLKARLEKEISARKAEIKRAMVRRLEETFAQTFPAGESNKISTVDHPLIVGSEVSTPLGIRGKIEKIEGRIAEIQAGPLRIREKISNLRAADPAAASGKQSSIKIQFTESVKEVPRELNLIGMTTAEAERVLDRFIDEAYLASLPRIRVIHGFGTGALRKFVHKLLKENELVERFFFAPANEGGNGATIVELRTI